MKQKLLLKTMLLLFALIAGSSSVWADSVTYNFSSLASTNSWSNGTAYTSIVIGDITLSAAGGGNNGKYYTTDNSWRMYNGGTVNITAANGYEITAVSSTPSKTFTITNGAASLSCTETIKFTSITVTYQNPSDTRTETTVTIAGNETERYMDQSATTPSATVKAGDTPIDGASVTWSSTETGVATISSTGAITLVAPGTTTIKAQYAGNATYKPSESSYTLNVYGVFTTMAQLQAGCKMTFNNVYVTAVKGNNAYISDGTNGAVIFKSSHGFVAGDKLASTALEMTMMNYNGYTPEITSLTKTTDGLTVTSGNEITPTSLAVNAITTANFGTLVKITSVTYDATNKVFKDASSNEIAYYDNFSASPTLIDGEEYDVTGIILFKNNTTVEICPRTAADVTPKVVKTNPGTKWYTDNTETSEITTITINKIDGDVQYFVSTAYTGAISYESSDESVATIANDGTISPVGYGTTTIKASTPATDAFFASEASFTLTVKDDFVDLLLPGNVTFSGDGYSAWSNISGLWSGATYAGNTYKVSTRFQLKVDNSVGIVVTSSVGRVKKISIAWNSGTTTDRTLNIFGSNTPYTTVAVGANEESIGSFSSNTPSVTELTVDADKNYGYIRIAAAGGALYLDKIQIEWDKAVRCVEIGQYEWATFVSDQIPYFEGSGINAYIVTGHNGNAITKSDALTTAPANTPLLLNAAQGTYAIPLAGLSSTNVDDNLLKAGTGAAISKEDGKTKYVLGVEGGKATFLKIDGTAATVPTDKAYLEFDEEIAAPMLSFDGEGTTGIKVIDNGQLTIDNYYNLAGQRVAQPRKGLYIVNGKKVVIK